ncbi:MAG: helix-turn-helix transcriptional regulator [Bacillota bacterium]|nr:helix-turn-helix transcriptional regulator [Bacillota bacterium]
MNKQEFISLMNEKLKLVRTEYRLTQDKMAAVMGMSKKTLVEIEKGRRSLGWSGAVVLASVFSDSTVLQDSLGGELSDMIAALAFDDVEVKYPKTMGGKVWWKNVEEKNGYRIQQNMVSRHYRLLDPENNRVIASFDFETVRAALSNFAL